MKGIITSICELEEETSVLESECVYASAQIAEMTNDRVISILKREVIGLNKNIRHLDEVKYILPERIYQQQS